MMAESDMSVSIAPDEQVAGIHAMEEEFGLPLHAAVELDDGSYLSPLLKVQLDSNGTSLLVHDIDKQQLVQYYTEQGRASRRLVGLHRKKLGLRPLGKMFYRMILSQDGTSSRIITGYTEEQFDEDDRVASLDDLPPGTLAVVLERTRQVVEEGWEIEADHEKYTQGELVAAAMNYLGAALSEIQMGLPYEGPPPSKEAPWPWDASWWKPDGLARNLEKAGALICAQADAEYYGAWAKEHSKEKT